MSTTRAPNGSRTAPLANAPSPTRERKDDPVTSAEKLVTPTTPPSTRDVSLAPRVALLSLPVLALDPEDCRSSGVNWIYDVSATPSIAPEEDIGIGADGLVDSIRDCGGNHDPGLVIEQPDGVGRYRIVAGHRRCRACGWAGVAFSARVLPADTPEEALMDLAIMSNATQRVRSPISRMREAMHMEPTIRERLDRRKRAGAKPADDPEGWEGEFHEVVARKFFGGRISAETARKLHAIVRLAESDDYETCSLWTQATDRRKTTLRATARDAVIAIHREELTVGAAYAKLRTVKKERKLTPAAEDKAAGKAEEATRADAAARIERLMSDLVRLSIELSQFTAADAPAEFSLGALTGNDRSRLMLPERVNDEPALVRLRRLVATLENGIRTGRPVRHLVSSDLGD